MEQTGKRDDESKLFLIFSHILSIAIARFVSNFEFSSNLISKEQMAAKALLWRRLLGPISDQNVAGTKLFPEFRGFFKKAE